MRTFELFREKTICASSFKHDGLKSFSPCALQIEGVFTGLDQLSETDKLEQLLKLKLRYFTPREVANLMGFPPHFCKSKCLSTGTLM